MCISAATLSVCRQQNYLQGTKLTIASVRVGCYGYKTNLEENLCLSLTYPYVMLSLLITMPYRLSPQSFTVPTQCMERSCCYSQT